MTTEATQQEEKQVPPSLLETLPFNLDEADEVTRSMTHQIAKGFDSINEANLVLIKTEGQKTQAEIHKEIRNYSGDSEELLSAKKEFVEAENAFKKIAEAARKSYRQIVLGIEDAEDKEIDKEAVMQERKIVMEAISLLKTFSTLNSNSTVFEWVSALEVPMVGRQGTSVVGQKKPRVYVLAFKRDENGNEIEGSRQVFNSAGDAAKTLQVDGKSVTVSDLLQAWAEGARSKPMTDFSFGDFVVRFVPKEKKDEPSTRPSSETPKEKEEEPSPEELEEIELEDEDEEE